MNITHIHPPRSKDYDDRLYAMYAACLRALRQSRTQALGGRP